MKKLIIAVGILSCLVSHAEDTAQSRQKTLDRFKNIYDHATPIGSRLIMRDEDKVELNCLFIADNSDHYIRFGGIYTLSNVTDKEGKEWIFAETTERTGCSYLPKSGGESKYCSNQKRLDTTLLNRNYGDGIELAVMSLFNPAGMTSVADNSTLKLLVDTKADFRKTELRRVHNDRFVIRYETGFKNWQDMYALCDRYNE